jgi:hypothetical protein
MGRLREMNRLHPVLCAVVSLVVWFWEKRTLFPMQASSAAPAAAAAAASPLAQVDEVLLSQGAEAVRRPENEGSV